VNGSFVQNWVCVTLGRPSYTAEVLFARFFGGMDDLPVTQSVQRMPQTADFQALFTIQ
jgi:hypothetical protein